MQMTAMWMALGVLATGAGEPERPAVVDGRLRFDLFAAEPDLVTPTGLAVDERGRVLVIESHTHFRPDGYVGPPADRIRVFEDTDGDGRADRIGTFFEGSKYTMSLAIDRDGSVVVATRYEIFRLRDVDGDGAAEQKDPIARLDTPGNYPHNGLSGFAFDGGGNIYFGLGENLGAEYRLIGRDGTTLSGGGEGGNVYRCRPDGSGLVRVATGFWNPFHLAFDAFGRLFAVDNDPDARPPCRLLHVVEGGDYGYRFRNGRKGLHPFTAWNGELPGTLPMVAGTGEAPSGLVAYESDHLPADYRGTLLATSWGDHRIERFGLRAQGASFRSTLEPVIGGGEDFRPVGIATAPDGSLFVSDWVSKSYPLHGKGRLWHLRAVESPARVTPADPAQALGHADRPVRERAARRLAAGGESGRVVLRRVLAEGTDARARAVALVALVGSGEAGDDSLRGASRDPSPEIRALAVRILPPRLVDPETIAERDESAEVRAEALRRIGSTRGLPLLLKALEAADPFLAQAAREGLKRTASEPRLLDLARTDDAAQRLGIALVLRDLDTPTARTALPGLLADPEPSIRFAAIQWVGERGLAEFRARLAEGMASGASTRSLFEAYLAALERLDGISRPAKEELAGEEYVARLLADPATSPSVRRRALRMLRPDHPRLTLNRLRGFLAVPDLATNVEAVRTLRENPDRNRLALLAGIAQDRRHPLELRAEAILGLSAGDDGASRDLLLDLAADPESAVRHEALRSLRGSELSGEQRARLAESTPDDESKALVARLIGREAGPAPPAGGDLDAWLKSLEGPADPAAGERVFFHPNGPGCFRCHQIDGRGGRAGPDLSTTGRVLDRPRLVASILEPSKEVAPQFVPWVIEKTDGSLVTGILLGETAEGDQTYADVRGEAVTLKASEIAARRTQAASIMPDDLARLMTLQEFRDLIAYLQQPRPGDAGSKEAPQAPDDRAKP